MTSDKNPSLLANISLLVFIGVFLLGVAIYCVVVSNHGIDSSYSGDWEAAYKKSNQEMLERMRSEGTLRPSATPTTATSASRDDRYQEKYARWKEGILSNTAVTGIAVNGRISIFVTLTVEKYANLSGVQDIARQLAISYCRATGVSRAHVYVMRGSENFADALGE
jgi:hypothetical protein